MVRTMQRLLLAMTMLLAGPATGLAQIQLGGGLGGSGKPDPTPHVDLEVVADAEGIPAGGKVTLGLHFKLDDKWHIYWRNHGASGMPPRVDWQLPDGFKAGPLLHPAPETYTVEGVGTTYVHHGEPVLLAEITAPADAPVGQTIELSGTASWLVCEKSCLPGEQKFTISLPVISAGEKVKPAHEDLFTVARLQLPKPTGKAKYAKIDAKLSVDRVRPKDKFTAALVLDVAKGHHIQSNKPLSEFLIATQVFLDSGGGLFLSDPVFPKHKVRTVSGMKLAEFDGLVVIRIPAEADGVLETPSSKISGVVTYQACTDDGTCFPPETVEWSVAVPFAKAGETVSSANGSLFGLAQSPDGADGASKKQGGFTLEGEVALQESSTEHPLWLYILMALAGGLFLNITPCVLPVIGIKILSFVQQAGEDPRRVRTINLVFSAGLISVFIILATLAVFLGYGWGALFHFASFNIVMAAIVFAMGLSFFGVFEIPVPGWVNRAGGVEREGLPGTFIKGVLATFLATPCAGPLMGVMLAWSVAQSAPVTYIVWTTIGVGMALPYLLAAVSPGVVKWLPKPGIWMERVKQFMGFILMATTVYFLKILPDTYVIWTAFFLVGLALACWMIGQLVTINSTVSRKLVVRSFAALIVLAMGVVSFRYMIPATVAEHATKLRIQLDQARSEGGSDNDVEATALAGTNEQNNHLPWIPFSIKRLEEYTAQGRTVLVDFTAEWCLNCKLNEINALNTEATKTLVLKNNVVCLLADYTEQSPEIKAVLNKLGSISVPLTAIFPAGRPNEVIPLRELYTQGALLEALEKAGPSLTKMADAGSHGGSR